MNIKVSIFGRYDPTIVIIILLLPIAGLCIMLNLGIVREIIVPLYFTLAIGYLIMRSINLKLEKFSKAEIIYISTGIGVSILMIIGAALSIILPYYKILQPLSPAKLVLLFSFLILILSSRFITNSSKKYLLLNVHYTVTEIISVIISLTLLSFTLLSINILDLGGNNIPILATIVLIIVYCIFLSIVCYFYDFNDSILAVNIYIISFTLLLLRSWSSNYLAGYNDIDREFYLFIKTLMNKCWSYRYMYSTYNVCMSITVLPTIYKILMGLDNPYIYFKAILQAVIALLPVGIFYILKQELNNLYSFILSIIYIFQYQYILLLSVTLRTGIALVIFSLVIYSYLHKHIKNIARKALIVFFLFSTVLSHYTTTYVTYVFIILIFLEYIFFTKKPRYTNLVIYFTVAIVFWYLLITGAAFSSMLYAIRDITTHTSYLLKKRAYSESTLKATGMGVTNLPQAIKVAVYDILYTIIFVGILVYILKRIKNRKFDEYLYSRISMLIIFVIFVILPYSTNLYSIERASLQFLVVLIIGIYYTTHKLKRSYGLLAAIILFIFLAFVGTGVNYVVLGTPQLSPMYLSKESAYRHFIYIYDGEITGGKWINKFGNHKSVIYGDFVIDSRILLSTLSTNSFKIGIIGSAKKRFWLMDYYCYLNSRGASRGDYIYLRYFNIKYNKIYDGCTVHYINGKITEEKNLPLKLNSVKIDKIYSNKFNQIYIFTKNLKPLKQTK